MHLQYRIIQEWRTNLAAPFDPHHERHLLHAIVNQLPAALYPRIARIEAEWRAIDASYSEYFDVEREFYMQTLDARLAGD